MRKGWENKKLGEVCEFENGDRGVNYPSKSYRTEIGVPFINAGHLSSNGLDLKNMDYISRERFNLLGSGKIQKDDILFCLRGSLGKFAQVKEFSEGAIASSLVIIRPKAKVLSNFLMIYFGSQICADMISRFSNGAAQPNLSASSLKNFEIPLPPLPEQQRIVAILDKAFAAIERAKANTEKNLQNAKELFESYLQNIFSHPGKDWEEKRLMDVCDLITDGTHFSPKNTSQGDYKYVTAKNIKPYHLDLSNISYISAKNHKEIYGRCPVKKGDVLYIKDGATAGIATINPLDEEFSLLSSVALLKPSFLFLNTFLVFYMNSYWGKKNFLGYKDGAAITRLTLVKLKNVRVPVPPIKTQNEIVSMANILSAKTKKLEYIYQQKLEDQEELKKSILQKAFKGQLDYDSYDLSDLSD